MKNENATKEPLHPDLAEYLAAPESVRKQFDRRLADEVAADTDFRRWMAEVDSDDYCPPEQPAQRLPRTRVRWDDSWRRRAQVVRLAGNASVQQGFARRAAERELLLSLAPPEYIGALTGEEVPDSGYICCPLHQERTPSCQVFEEPDRGWRCFGCDRAGDIYTFAAALWELKPRGDDFNEVHARLLQVFAP